MSTKEDEFLQSLRATFKVEAAEHLETISNNLLKLEKAIAAAEQQLLVETVFRAAHSLKGAARAVNFAPVESVCQTLEDVFAAWKRQESVPSPAALDIIHQVLEAVSKEIANPGTESSAGLSAHVQALRNLSPAEASSTPEQKAPEPAPPPSPNKAMHAQEKPAFAETVRVSVAKLDAQLLEAEEMLAAKLLMRQRATELKELVGHLDEWKTELEKIQPSLRTLRLSLEGRADLFEQHGRSALHELVEFIAWNHDYFRKLEAKAATQRRAAAHDNLLVGKLVDDLLDDSKKLLLLPFATLSVFFQRIARDLCRDQGKQADLVIVGEEVEIDKRVLEEMKDPLTHIIRNAIDHGLESPEERKRKSKPERGNITLRVSPLDGDKLAFVITDDGVGIDVAKVRKSALKHGVVSQAEANHLSDAEATQLVLRSGVSTSAMITELSGRGLGLAIAREHAEHLGGKAFVESSPAGGTTIRITVPIALRTFRGILVEAGKQLFVVPTAEVARVAQFRSQEIQTVEGQTTLTVDGRAMSLCRLVDILELAASDSDQDLGDDIPVIILGTGDERVAFAVTAVLDEQEVLVKRFKRPLERVRNISGATVLGSGQVAPILNVPDLLKSARRPANVASGWHATPQPEASTTKSILVAEDSITSRMLLRGILETAGYEVTTAVDGVDAFTMLRTRPFDLVISDVEMPRQNGFDLTEKIRADKKLAELPVILVTALETNADRERGIDVGANAYLVKSSFDQSNLLETVKRLI